QSFFNDELHQERIAIARGRPVENKTIGLRMNDPAFDLAKLAAGRGVTGYGPVATEGELERTLSQACSDGRAGASCVLVVLRPRRCGRSRMDELNQCKESRTIGRQQNRRKQWADDFSLGSSFQRACWPRVVR